MKALLCTALALTLATTPATLRTEDKVPKPAPLVRLTSASVKDDKLTGVTTVSVTKLVDQVMSVIVDGKLVNVTRKVPVIETVNLAVEYALKNAKVTSLVGKEIAAVDLADSVKDVTVAVFPTASKPTEKDRKEFPKGTIFIELLEKK